MSMMMRRGMMVPKAPGGLPAEYLAVQYLEGTGTQCIDTGYVPTTSTNVLMKKGQNTGGVYNFLFGCGISRDQLSVGAQYVNYFNSVNQAIANNPQNNACTLEIINGIVYVDGTSVLDLSSSTGSASLTLSLFCRKGSSGYERFTAMKVYAFKMWEGNVLIRDMIPCIRISDSKPGMYDLVGRTFYTNQGTGEFLFSMGENFCEPLSGTWYEREQNGTITYTSGTGTVISATGTTGWSLYMFSGNNSKTFAQLEGKKLYLEYEVDDITIDNSSSITFGICTFRKNTPTSNTDRKAYTTGADYASILMPRTDGTYKGIFTVDTDTIIPHSDDFSKNNFIGVCVYLNGHSGDTLTIKRLELHEILEP